MTRKMKQNPYPNGTVLNINSRRYGLVKAEVIKYIPNDEWYCKIINSHEDITNPDYFVKEEILSVDLNHLV